MAKLRQNHTRSGKQPFAGLALRVFLIFGILSILFVVVFRYMDTSSDGIVVDVAQDVKTEALVPIGNTAEIIEHTYYLLGYNEEHEQADWVSYELTAADLKVPNVPRAKRFEEDPLVASRSSRHGDYSRSGYSRGHMAPAGDMAFNETAMQESFFMSNMSPQLIGYNGGVWRELEECTRDWAYKYGRLLVASGPLFNDVTEYIGKSSKVRVPSAFFKIIVNNNGPHSKGIAFVIPHEVTEKHLHEFAYEIDRVEEMIGLDFFDDTYDSAIEEQQIEGAIDNDLWPVSQKRYKNRINHWNNK